MTLSTRDQIIATTCELLELQGYHATGLNQIIKESGSPKGSLYYHFPRGKEELAVEAIKRVGDSVLKRIHEQLALVEDAAQAIEAFIQQIAYQVERSGFRAGGPITTIAMEMATTSEPLRQTCEHIYQAWRAAFADKLLSGGITRERAERLATLIISAIEGGVILCRTERNPQPLLQVAQEIGHLIRLSL